MRFLVDQMLRCALVHVRMRLQLKQEVQDVDKEQNLLQC
jgi:hypothetical protein